MTLQRPSSSGDLAGTPAVVLALIGDRVLLVRGRLPRFVLDERSVSCVRRAIYEQSGALASHIVLLGVWKQSWGSSAVFAARLIERPPKSPASLVPLGTAYRTTAFEVWAPMRAQIFSQAYQATKRAYRSLPT